MAHAIEPLGSVFLSEVPESDHSTENSANCCKGGAAGVNQPAITPGSCVSRGAGIFSDTSTVQFYFVGRSLFLDTQMLFRQRRYSGGCWACVRALDLGGWWRGQEVWQSDTLLFWTRPGGLRASQSSGLGSVHPSLTHALAHNSKSYVPQRPLADLGRFWCQRLEI